MLPTIVIIGRRNVGKSALFNRLIEKDKAIVSEIEGTTRDRTEGICGWRGQKLRIVDTGGMDVGDKNTIDREVKKQAAFAMRSADLVLFLVDARVGSQPSERNLAKKLHQLKLSFVALDKAKLWTTKSRVILVANKAETEKWRQAAADPAWKRLGFGLPQAISALTGQGVGDLLDAIFTRLNVGQGFIPRRGEAQDPALQSQTDAKPDFRIAIIGKPNVGKSSLINKVLGEERVIVSPVPHTTREPQDTLFTYALDAIRYKLLLIDTAGIRRKAKIAAGIEALGVNKTLSTISRSDVVIFVLDATEPLDAQDKHLAGMIEEKGVGVVIAVNKWDLSPARTTKQGDLFLKQIHFGLPGLTFAPVVFISALSGHNVHKLLPLAIRAHENRKRIISDEELKSLLPKLVKHHRPARSKAGSRHPIIRRIEQTANEPPTFVIIIDPKQSLHESYLRFIKNQLRRYFDFEGTPLKIWVKQERQ